MSLGKKWTVIAIILQINPFGLSKGRIKILKLVYFNNIYPKISAMIIMICLKRWWPEYKFMTPVVSRIYAGLTQPLRCELTCSGLLACRLASRKRSWPLQSSMETGYMLKVINRHQSAQDYPRNHTGKAGLLLNPLFGTIQKQYFSLFFSLINLPLRPIGSLSRT